MPLPLYGFPMFGNPASGSTIHPLLRHSNTPFSTRSFLLDIQVYKGGGRLYIAALNYRHSEKEES